MDQQKRTRDTFLESNTIVYTTLLCWGKEAENGWGGGEDSLSSRTLFNDSLKNPKIK